MKTLSYALIGLVLIVWSCAPKDSNNFEEVDSTSDSSKNHQDLNLIPVLNFGTFHMGFTTDATNTEFDEHDRENQKEAHKIAKMLAAFKPTVIIVETEPERNAKLQADYQAYLDNPDTVYESLGEIRLIAYELGRLAGTKRIYGIDHKMGYNYMIGETIEENLIDSVLHDSYYNDPLAYYPEVDVDQDTLNLLDKLKITNHDEYLDFLITVNADALTFVGSEEGFEGADEAARYYQRNLRMFSNLNRIKLDPSDRVFVLMGASHTAFFRDFISRSPKYYMVNTFDYLK